MSEPTPVGEALDRVLRALGAPPADALTRLQEEWPAIVGELLAAHSRVESVVDGRVRVAVDGNAWATELRYREPAVLGWFQGVAEVTRMDLIVTPPW